MVSLNFALLQKHDSQLVRLGSQAEQYFADDPNTCLIKLRQFGELLAQLLAAKAGLYETVGENQVDLLRRLQAANAVDGEALELFHQLRKTGNEAVHGTESSHRTALSHLKYARLLGIWFHRSYGGERNFKPGAFVPPPDPVDETESLREELKRLRQEWEKSRSQTQQAQAIAAEEAKLRQLAERLLEETETKKAEIEQKLAQIQAETLAKPQAMVQSLVQKARQAGQTLDLDERETRILIDEQLSQAGWEVDTENLRYNLGTRPEKGKYRAIAEWPTENGTADYALFAGLQAIAVVEAKRQSKDVMGALEQAKRYSRGFQLHAEAKFLGEPWAGYRVPFMFATNGREFLEQLRTKSGIWFWDARRSQNISRPLRMWYSPQDLLDLLGQDVDAAHRQLEAEPFNYDFGLRSYQIEAIQAIEAALARDQRSLLLAMATGTGKTKTSIALIYRLLKSKRFRRILFLVDRTALGNQANDAFRETRMESLQSFADIFEVKSLQDLVIDRDTKVHIATVQALVKRLLYPADDSPVLTAGQYDCIIVDECHRGYLLDKEMSEVELEFRDLKDYVCKYRQVLEFFDAVKIGLTATPALHTSEIFGKPIFKYSYRDAVIDGYLIDHDPPTQIVTELAEDGIHWEAGAEMQYFDPLTGKIDLTEAPDELNFDVGQFNKWVINSNFDRVICQQLAQHIDPSLDEKTLIFCVRDEHCDRIVDELKRAFAEDYGEIEDDAVVKITGAADKPDELIRRFKNEQNPKVAVTVDLLTTGIDVPRICNLVFLRRVNSRILYEQMLGRATRRCDEIGKEVFHIFDAVNLYVNLEKFTEMKPVAVNPQISFQQLFEELETVSEENAIAQIVTQLLAKLQRQRRHLQSEQEEAIAQIAGISIEEIAPLLRQKPPAEQAQWLQQRRDIAQMLDRRDGGRQPIFISTQSDRVRRIERGYGEGITRPDDYLDEFSTFLRENINRIPALLVVTQRPKELTRQQLKALCLELEQAGFTEANLQAAWREKTNQDIAASIIGFIRQAALGDGLISYEARVDRALQKLSLGRSWTPVQRKWLDRIAKQLKREKIVDPSSLDRGAFRSQGGLKQMNKVFNGEIEKILLEIKDYIWQEAN